MRQYIDIIAQYIAEAILATLEPVPSVPNQSRKIGAAGTTVSASMTDMLPHHGVRDRNKPPAFAEMFAKIAATTPHNDSFERETPPPKKDMQKRRNNNAGFDKLKSVAAKGDASATLHSDYAGRTPNEKSIIPRHVHKPNRQL